MESFNIKKAKERLLKEEQTSSLEEINPDFTTDKIVTTSNYADNSGRLKPQFGSESYDFGGSEEPIPNSTVVDTSEPDGDNKWIDFNLNKVGKFPPKKYINLTFSIGHIDNWGNLIKTILNSLESGGILVVTEQSNWVSDFYDKLKSNFDILEVYDFLSNMRENLKEEMSNDEWVKKFTKSTADFRKSLENNPKFAHLFDVNPSEEDEEDIDSISLILKKK